MKMLRNGNKVFDILAFAGYSETKFVKEGHGSKEDWAKIVKLQPKKATKKK